MNKEDQANSAIDNEGHSGERLVFPRPPECPSLELVEATVRDHFPSGLPALKACLTASATLLIEDNVDPSAMMLQGVASSIKTTVLDMFEEVGPLAYRSDKFTPKSFVSHHAAAKRETLKDVDLLPRIRHRVMITPELAPLFRGREDDLTENFTILTAVLDGHGLTTDSGTHGRRGYTGDYLFSWLGATTPLPSRTWRVMAQLGSRLYFWPMPDDTPSDEALDQAIVGEFSYKEKLVACQKEVGSFVRELFGWWGGVRGVKWDREATPQAFLDKLRPMARLVCRLRGVVSIWREGRDGALTYTPPNIEWPYRAQSIFFNLARGHALINGRNFLIDDDLMIIAPLAIGSAPTERRNLFLGLLQQGGTLTAREAAGILKVTRPTARKYLKEFELLGIGAVEGDPEDEGRGDEPTQRLILGDEWHWFLSEEFQQLLYTGPRNFPPPGNDITGRGVERVLALSNEGPAGSRPIEYII